MRWGYFTCLLSLFLPQLQRSTCMYSQFLTTGTLPKVHTGRPTGFTQVLIALMTLLWDRGTSMEQVGPDLCTGWDTNDDNDSGRSTRLNQVVSALTTCIWQCQFARAFIWPHSYSTVGTIFANVLQRAQPFDAICNKRAGMNVRRRSYLFDSQSCRMAAFLYFP